MSRLSCPQLLAAVLSILPKKSVLGVGPATGPHSCNEHSFSGTTSQRWVSLITCCKDPKVPWADISTCGQKIWLTDFPLTGPDSSQKCSGLSQGKNFSGDGFFHAEWPGASLVKPRTDPHIPPFLSSGLKWPTAHRAGELGCCRGSPKSPCSRWREVGFSCQYLFRDVIAPLLPTSRALMLLMSMVKSNSCL